MGGWLGGWCGRIENKTISAFNLVEVEVQVEAELGNRQLINYLETGDKLPAVSSEVEDYMLACENGPPESGLGVF